MSREPLNPAVRKTVVSSDSHRGHAPSLGHTCTVAATGPCKTRVAGSTPVVSNFKGSMHITDPDFGVSYMYDA